MNVGKVGPSSNTFGETLWISLPMSAFLVDPNDLLVEVNPAAETFLNTSARSLRGAPLWDRLTIDAPLDSAFARVRTDNAPLFINNVDVTGGNRPPVECNIQIAPVTPYEGYILVLIEIRQIADRLTRGRSMQFAAKSAIGMAEMLAHEIKNPLAGITGAAQLLSMNLSNGDLEMTDLIVEESRRIVKLLEQVEQFGNLRPPVKKPVNIHDLLDKARRSASVGFAAHMKVVEAYDPSLPPTLVDADQMLQVFLNLLKNAAQAAGNEGNIKIRTFYETSLRVRRKDGTGLQLPLHVEIIDDGPGLPPEIADEIFKVWF